MGRSTTWSSSTSSIGRTKPTSAVFQLLAEKFSLFEGVFGAATKSSEPSSQAWILRSASPVSTSECRTPAEIKASFDQLQLELGAQINDAMTRTRRQLLENFDAEVHEKLRVSLDESRSYLNRYERLLMQLTRHELGTHAEFANGYSAFRLKSNPFPEAGNIPIGLYELPRRSGEAHLYRMGHPLAELILQKAKERVLPNASITFDYRGTQPRVGAFESFADQMGELLVCLFTVESLDQAEDHLLAAAITEEGKLMPDDIARRFFALSAVDVEAVPAFAPNTLLVHEIERSQAAIRQQVSERSARVFEAEATKLDGWADDLKVGLEREIKDLDRQIKEAKRAATVAPTLEEKLAGQKQIKTLEAGRNGKRRSLFDAQDEIDQRRDQLIREIEGKLDQKQILQNVLSIRWRLA